MALNSKVLTGLSWGCAKAPRGFFFRGAACAVLLLVDPFGLRAQQLLDDLNRPASATVAGSWTETETVASGAQVNASGQLELGSTTAGRDYVAQDMSGFHNTTYGANTCLLTWAFCMRQTRTDPSGFAASNYGVAYVLGATTSNLNTVSNGYAVVLGQSGATDNLRLVRFTGGLAGTQTTLITGAADLGANYMAIRVTFDPATGQWQLFANTGLSAAAFSTTNPTGVVTSLGTVVNTTYTAAALPFGGCYWNHASGAGETALFDNIYIPQACIPTVNFATTSAFTLETAGSVTVNINIFPATVTGGNIVVTAVDGAGVTYGAGNDYTTVPAVIASDITIPVAPGATTASFNLSIFNDILNEGNETITFTITSTTNDLVLGTSLVYTQTIVDNDGLPEVNFTTLSMTVLETAAGTYTFNLLISPASTVAGNVTVTVTPGIGATCGVGTDYQGFGFGCSASFTIPVIVGQTALLFQCNVFDDIAIVEPTEQVTFTVTGIPVGLQIGANNSGVLNIADNDSPPTVLTPGDVVIVGLNANNAGCPGGSSGEDFISFFCFKTIQNGTTIILTDNGWERCFLNRWGNTEGTVQMTRTGAAIPAGQVITFRVVNASGAGNVIGAAPDGAWTCTSLNGGTTLNMNSGGDQIFFMQGGTWTTNSVGLGDAQYSGSILYGFSTVPWGSVTCGSPTGNQRSNLPIGMNCFSMSPTTSADFAKYIGPLTITTQRLWIIRVDDVANWTSLGTCATYNSTLPNWLLAPTLPITAGGFTPGLWRGATASQDWFDCKNWDDAEVPITTTNVRIDETAVNSCIVGVTPGGNAVCASLVQTNSGTARNLTVTNSSSLAVGGPITTQRTSAGTGISLTVLGNSTLTATNFTVQGTAANEATLRNELAGNTVTFSGALTIGTGGLVDLNGGAAGGTIYIGGNYSNAGPTEATLDEAFGQLVFNGAATQSITTVGGFQDILYNLTANKSAGTLTLNSPVAVRNVLDLTSGLINTNSATGLLTMRAGSSWTNATDASFVNGPMEKIGLTDFTFPIGKVNNLRPSGLAGITGAATDAFISEYFPLSAWTWGINLEPTINHVSDCEYWTLQRSAGSPNATVVLTWEAPASCGVNNLTDLIVARWDTVGTDIWRDRGNGGAAGSFLLGSIPTAAVQNAFTVWTLASTTNFNPLPITVVDFTAKPENGMVRLEWVTATERENAFFTVERSVDGIIFEYVLDVPGAVNSNVVLTYTDLDRMPYQGLSYYRLKQTDTNGNTSVSPMVAVMLGARPLVVFGNTNDLAAVHNFPVGSRYTLLDMMGRILKDGTTTSDGRTDLGGLNLARGAYVFRVSNGERAESTRFVY